MTRITATIGPPVLPPGHESPHFDAAGDCLCSCTTCAWFVNSKPGFEFSECICPECPCVIANNLLTIDTEEDAT